MLHLVVVMCKAFTRLFDFKKNCGDAARRMVIEVVLGRFRVWLMSIGRHLTLGVGFCRVVKVVNFDQTCSSSKLIEGLEIRVMPILCLSDASSADCPVHRTATTSTSTTKRAGEIKKETMCAQLVED